MHLKFHAMDGEQDVTVDKKNSVILVFGYSL